MESKAQFQPLRAIFFSAALLVAFVASSFIAPISFLHIAFAIVIGVCFSLVVLPRRFGAEPQPISSMKFTGAILLICLGHTFSDKFFTQPVYGQFYWWIFAQFISAALLSFMLIAVVRIRHKIVG